MISKKLLSEILGEHITWIKPQTHENNIISYDINCKEVKYINIHKLARKYKKWALKNCYDINHVNRLWER